MKSWKNKTTIKIVNILLVLYSLIVIILSFTEINDDLHTFLCAMPLLIIALMAIKIAFECYLEIDPEERKIFNKKGKEKNEKENI